MYDTISAGFSIIFKILSPGRHPLDPRIPRIPFELFGRSACLQLQRLPSRLVPFIPTRQSISNDGMRE